MKTTQLTKEDRALISEAHEVILKNRANNDNYCCSVGSALLTDKGKTFRGVSLESKTSSSSFCGETGAILQMLAGGGNEIKTIVALWVSTKDHAKWGILQPCGSCRHNISYFGDPWVIISETKKVRLGELYPLSVKR